MPACFETSVNVPLPLLRIQPVRHPVEHRRMAVHAVAVFLQAAVRVLREPEVEVVGDVEIEVSVAIEIEEPRARAPLGGPPGDACCGGDVAERAVAVVLVEHVWAEAGHIEIEIAVAVVIANGDAGLVRGLAGATSVDARPRGHVGERPILVVVIQHVAGARRAVDEIQVFEAVVVVVDPGDTGAEGLDHELLWRGAGLVDERDSCLCRDVSKDGRAIGGATHSLTGQGDFANREQHKGSEPPALAHLLAAPSFFCFASPASSALRLAVGQWEPQLCCA